MINFSLSPKDKTELLNFIDEYANKISINDIREIEDKLKRKINILSKNKKLPSYCCKMIKQLTEMSMLLESPNINAKKLDRVIAALHYFIWPDDKIADYVPVVGYLDDAFIASVVYSEVGSDIDKEKERRNAK